MSTSRSWRRSRAKIVDVNKGNYETFRAIHRNPKPVIVALHSFVLGGGIGMAGAADIILCSDCARFGVPEIDRGAMGGGAHLQRMFPVQKVRYMYFTGEFIDAQEAYRLGAVERVVPLDELLPTAREIAAKIAEKSPAMVKLAKEALTGIEDGNLEDKYRWEQGFTLEAYTMGDSQESRDAFVAKRDAKFTGLTNMDLAYTAQQQAFRAEMREWLAANVPEQPLQSFDTAEGFAAAPAVGGDPQ